MPRKKIFYAWLCNRTSRDDDEPIKIKAENLEQAEKVARFTMDSGHFMDRFSLRGVYTAKDFAKYYRGWPRIMNRAKIYEQSGYDIPEVDEGSDDESRKSRRTS